MPHSYARVAIHLTFSTKNRKPLITPEIRPQLIAYVVGILRNLDSPSIKTNVVDTHAHSLFLLSKKRALDFVVEEAKRSSSKWIKTKGPAFTNFYWQIGYAAFSVGQEDIERVADYIDRQEEHHRTVSFEDEIRALFKQYGLKLDEEHFFD
jgi:REP element-mobilizing transposase RayT